jgi:hypothetical protein
MLLYDDFRLQSLECDPRLHGTFEAVARSTCNAPQCGKVQNVIQKHQQHATDKSAPFKRRCPRSISRYVQCASDVARTHTCHRRWELGARKAENSEKRSCGLCIAWNPGLGALEGNRHARSETQLDLELHSTYDRVLSRERPGFRQGQRRCSCRPTHNDSNALPTSAAVVRYAASSIHVRVGG